MGPRQNQTVAGGRLAIRWWGADVHWAYLPTLNHLRRRQEGYESFIILGNPGKI